MSKREMVSVLEFAERFWRRVGVRGPEDCWPWLGGFVTNGYGVLEFPRSWQHAGLVPAPQGRAHRVARALADNPNHPNWFGPYRTMYVLHSCDFKPCCNPSHLRWGTPQENIQDRQVRGRTASKLTPEKVRELRLAHASGEGDYGALAQRFGIHDSMVSLIVRRKRWAHVA